MQGLTAKDFQPEVLQLFDRYVHGLISRRGFLDQAASLVGSGVAAAGLLSALSPQFAQAQQVRPGDVRLQTRYQVFDSPQGHGEVRGYLAKPAGRVDKLPTVLVIHENRGLSPHIEDITRRLALDGFLAFAPDALSSVGGYPGDEDRARALFAKLDAGKVINDFIAAARTARLPGRHGQSGCRRLLLRGQCGQHPGRPDFRTGRRRSLLWRPTPAGGCAKNQGALAASLCRSGSAG